MGFASGKNFLASSRTLCELHSTTAASDSIAEKKLSRWLRSASLKYAGKYRC
jgi:hypothetical protein